MIKAGYTTLRTQGKEIKVMNDDKLALEKYLLSINKNKYLRVLTFVLEKGNVFLKMIEDLNSQYHKGVGHRIHAIEQELKMYLPRLIEFLSPDPSVFFSKTTLHQYKNESEKFAQEYTKQLRVFSYF